MQALMNIDLMNNYKIKTIVTTCPHAFNTIKNEYKSLGGNYQVYHHTEFIVKLINNKRLILNKSLNKIKVTYHDPCYLGRGNNIYEDPRTIINKLGYKMIEMKEVKENHFVVVQVALKCLKNLKMEIKILILIEQMKHYL